MNEDFETYEQWEAKNSEFTGRDAGDMVLYVLGTMLVILALVVLI